MFIKKIQNLYNCWVQINSKQKGNKKIKSPCQPRSWNSCRWWKSCGPQVHGQKMFCNKCYEALTLSNIIGEKINGLGLIFDVRCSKCQSVTKVPSSEKYDNSITKKQVFAINSKVVLVIFIFSKYLKISPQKLGIVTGNVGLSWLIWSYL